MGRMAERVAIVGAAASDSGFLPGRTPLELHLQAAIRALADAGLGKDEVDGLFSTGDHRYGMMPPVVLAEYMGLRPRYVDGTNVGGGASEFMVRHALGALQSGLCSVALLTYGATSRSIMTAANGPGERFTAAGTPTAYEDPFGMTLPSRAALVASRHMYEYGTTAEQLAAVAVAMRANAHHNLDAMYRTPITVDDVLSSRMIADPLHLLDCCVVSDGGGAVVLTAESRARDLDRVPVFVLGTGEALASETLAGWPEFGRLSTASSANEAFGVPISAQVTSTRCSSTTRSRSTWCCNSKRSAIARSARVAPSSPTASLHTTAPCRRTRTEAGCLRTIRDARHLLADRGHTPAPRGGRHRAGRQRPNGPVQRNRWAVLVQRNRHSGNRLMQHLPIPDPESAPFWQALAGQRLLLKWCGACDQWHFYPRVYCPFCWAATEWRDASGTGRCSRPPRLGRSD